LQRQDALEVKLKLLVGHVVHFAERGGENVFEPQMLGAVPAPAQARPPGHCTVSFVDDAPQKMPGEQDGHVAEPAVEKEPGKHVAGAPPGGHATPAGHATALLVDCEGQKVPAEQGKQAEEFPGANEPAAQTRGGAPLPGQAEPEGQPTVFVVETEPQYLPGEHGRRFVPPPAQ